MSRRWEGRIRQLWTAGAHRSTPDRPEGATRSGRAGVQIMRQRGPDGRCFFSGVGGEAQVGIHRAVKHHRSDVARKETGVDRPQGGAVPYDTP